MTDPPSDQPPLSEDYLHAALERAEDATPEPCEVIYLARECLRLRGLLAEALSREHTSRASELRDIACRIGPAALPSWVRGELEALASKLETWANAAVVARVRGHLGGGQR